MLRPPASPENNKPIVERESSSRAFSITCSSISSALRRVDSCCISQLRCSQQLSSSQFKGLFECHYMPAWLGRLLLPGSAIKQPRVPQNSQGGHYRNR